LIFPARRFLAGDDPEKVGLCAMGAGVNPDRRAGKLPRLLVVLFVRRG
jgi:hypothetical protein